MLQTPYCYYDMGRSAPNREHKNAERVDFDFSLKSLVRTQRGTIIPNWFKNPTTNPTTFLSTHKNVLFSNSSKGE
tara:strand:+ start:188 stop:412 length:225 start_codon:yes stop_codon:yes gene_type:complete